MANINIKELEAHIFGQIETERELQDEEFGGAEHDDKHSIDDWLEQITKHVNLARGEQTNYLKLRSRLVKIAALAVAGCGSQDRVNYNVATKENSSFEDWLKQIHVAGVIFGLYGAESKIEPKLWRASFDNGETPLEALLEDFSNM